jgi:hypothetical protein
MVWKYLAGRRPMAPGLSSYGVSAIPADLQKAPELTRALRATACALALLWGGSSALSAAAQAGPAEAEATLKDAAPKPAARKSPATKNPAPKDAPKAAETAAAEIPKALDELDPAQPVTETVVNVAGWIIATADNRGLPFAIVDKNLAQILVFDENGKLRGLAPVLVGSAVGDDSAEGVGDRELKDIPMEQRTTPAGRYLAGYGPATGGKNVLWVDYATSVSIHPMDDTRASRKEKRKERLASATPEDNRITHGCINVSPGFYSKIIRPTFRKGGVFYVLPDITPLQMAFPAYQQADAFNVSREAKKPPTKKRPPKKKQQQPAKSN